MSLAITLLISTVLALVIVKPLKRLPIVFYLLAIAISAVAVYLTWNPSATVLLNSAVFAVQKGHVGFSMFSVVMFIGVFARGSRIYERLAVVRRELSIVSALLILGHLTPYLLSYLAMSLNIMKYPASIIISIMTALILLALLLVLSVTSINVVRQKIDPSRWKKLQRCAYLFYALILVHLIGFMLPALMAGSTYALTNVIIYGVIFSTYLVARVLRARIDSRQVHSA